MSEGAEDINLEQMFDTGSDDGGSVEMDNTPDSFDDLIGEVNDSDNQESVENVEDNDSSIPTEQREEESSEISDESGSATSEADSDSSEGASEAKSEEEGDLEEDPIASYLKAEEEVKVNGEMQNFSREELLAKGKEMIAGEIAYDKKFSELDVERKQYQTEVAEVEGYINKFGEIAQTGDVLGALQYFSEFTSIPPYELKQQLINQLVPEVDRLRGLSESEAQLEYTQSKNEYLQQKYETETQRLESHQAQQEVANHVNGLQQSHNIAPTEWSEAEAILKDHPDLNQELTPELIADYVITDRAYVKAEGLLDTVDVSLKEDGSVLDEMQRIVSRNPEFTDDDLKEIVIQAFGKESQEEQQEQLSERIQKSSPKQLKQKSPVKHTPITIDGNEVDDWDDIV